MSLHEPNTYSQMRAGHFEVSDSVMTPEELEFLAEEELITIIPKISTSERDDAGRAGYLALLSGKLRTLLYALLLAYTLLHVHLCEPRLGVSCKSHA